MPSERGGRHNYGGNHACCHSWSAHSHPARRFGGQCVRGVEWRSGLRTRRGRSRSHIRRRECEREQELELEFHFQFVELVQFDQFLRLHQLVRGREQDQQFGQQLEWPYGWQYRWQYKWQYKWHCQHQRRREQDQQLRQQHGE